jgi:6-phosphofructokinase 1
LIKQRIQRRFAARGDPTRLTDGNLGYTLRCTPPVPFDIDYTRTLGHGAVNFLLNESDDERLREGGFVCLDGVNVNVLPFTDILDPETGRTRVRLVNVNSEYYRVAREYMIRLEPRDFEDRTTRDRLAAAAKLTPEEFERTFAPVLHIGDALATSR